MTTENTVSRQGTELHTEQSTLGVGKRPTSDSDRELAKPSDLFGGARYRGHLPSDSDRYHLSRETRSQGPADWPGVPRRVGAK